MTKLFRILIPLLLASIGYGEITLRSTTLSAAVAASDQEIFVASATGITAGMTAFVGKETMRVREVAGTRLVVSRGMDGTVTAHASGATIYVDERTYFHTRDPTGPCTVGPETVRPYVNMSGGRVHDCLSSVWTELVPGELVTRQNVGTAETGVTAVEYGDGRRRVTKLTFTDLTIGAAVGAANLGIGKKLYTLPAGAIVVKAAHMSVALTGSGATCDADTPDMGIGTVIASGAVALLSGTATFENMLTGQTVNDLAATAEVKTVSDQILPIEAAAAHTVHLNVADGWAGACTVTGTGTVALEWVLLN